MAMSVIKLQLIINHKSKERDLKELTLAKSDNNLCNYLTKMQEKRNDIDSLWKDGVKFDEQRWLTLCFEQLAKTGYSDFLDNIKHQKSEWVK